MSQASPAISVRAPAKLNLGLRVTGVRSDGYHELESLFVPLELADELRVEVSELAGGRQVELSVERPADVPGAVPEDVRNLASRAAAAFLAEAGVAARVGIRLRKRIPSPAGLGGGSSDAAAVLRALAARFPGALAPDTLAGLALSLGADVPFFLGPAGAGPVPARVGGIGERVRPAPDVPSLVVALVHPGPSLETSHVYAEFDALGGSLTGPGAATTMPAPEGGPEGWRSPEWLSRLLVNDLEPAARRLAPGIARVREALAGSGALAVGMSGSGPTLFGIFPDASAASAALAGALLRSALVAQGTGDRPAWTGVSRTLRSGEAG